MSKSITSAARKKPNPWDGGSLPICSDRPTLQSAISPPHPRHSNTAFLTGHENCRDFRLDCWTRGIWNVQIASHTWLAKMKNSGRGHALMHRLIYKMCNSCINWSFYLIDSTVQRRLLPLTSRLLPSRPPASHPQHAAPRPCCGVHDAAVVPPPPSPKQRQSSLSLRLPLLFPPCHLHFGLGAMTSTAESPHRASAGIEEGEGPIAPPTRRHKGGRKASNAKPEFTAVPGVGVTCLHCLVLVKTKQQSGTILAQHLCGCRLAPLSIQQMARDACSTLQKCNAPN